MKHPLSLRINKHRGFTLIEVLVTVIVLAIGLLGLAGLQINGLRFTYSAYQSSQATIMANDIIDRMRANIMTAQTGGYNVALGIQPTAASCEGAGANCSPAALASADLYEWKQTLSVILPAGDGSIAQNGELYTITVRWDDSRGEQDPKSLSVETLL